MFQYYLQSGKGKQRLFKVVFFLTIELGHFKNVQRDLTLLGFHTNTASVKYLAGLKYKSVSILPQKFIKSLLQYAINKAG